MAIDFTGPEWDQLRQGMAAGTEQKKFLLAAAQRFRALRVRPDLTFRCPDDDLLLAVYRTPQGMLWYRPAVRYGKGVRAGNGLLVGRALSVEDSGSHVKVGELAGLLTEAVPVACRHRLPRGSLSAEAIREALAGSDSPRTIKIGHESTTH